MKKLWASLGLLSVLSLNLLMFQNCSSFKSPLANSQAGSSVSTSESLSLNINSVNVVPGDKADLTLTLSSPLSKDLTVGYSTEDGTALAGTDYTAVSSGTLSIPAGSLSGQIEITTLASSGQNSFGKLFNVNVIVAAVPSLNQTVKVTFSAVPSAASTAALKNQWADFPASPSTPSARSQHTAIWTGSKMIVWGGYNGSASLGDGASYDPTTNLWTAISSVGAPSPRQQHTAIWTGSKMVIWGGQNGSTQFNGGGVYDPSTDTWSALEQSGAIPKARYGQVAVWTGTQMLVYGGSNDVGVNYTAGQNCTDYTNGCDLTLTQLTLGDLSAYDPSSGVWKALAASGGPSARQGSTAVWTGTSMVVWGGSSWQLSQNYGGPTCSATYNVSGLSTGSAFDPLTGLWSSVSASSGIAGANIASVWSGSTMLAFGGWQQTQLPYSFNCYQAFSYPQAINANSGATYNPSTNTWGATLAPSPIPVRAYQTAVWTGSSVILWGGTDLKNVTNDGGVYY